METFTLSLDKDVHKKAHLAFVKHLSLLSKLVPFGLIEHVGSTSISGSLTKGDLDIYIGVTTQRELMDADRNLSNHFERNIESDKTAEFSSFKNDGLKPPLGIQLVLKKSPYDLFLKFRDRIKNSACLLEQFNELKSNFNGKPMQEYRLAKSNFIESVLSEDDIEPDFVKKS